MIRKDVSEKRAGRMTEYTDDILIVRCKSKDVCAFNLLVERYKHEAYGFAYSYLKNVDDALSVSQDAFVRVWKSIAGFEEGRKFRPWLFSIIKNQALNVIDRNKSRREVSLDEAMETSGFDLPDCAPGPYDRLANSETRRQVWKAVMSLKKEFREVIVLKHFHDLSYAEMAEAIGIPEGTVMSRLYHARLALKQELTSELQRG